MKSRFCIQLATLFFSACVITSATAQTTPAAASQPASVQKLVIQVSDGETAKWNLALNNAKNVQEELGAKNVEIEIVAYGPGLGLLKLDAPVNSRVSELAKSGITVVACENTMRNQQLTRADMHPAASYASSGVVRIMQRQASGWSYVRP